jgi:serine/threonine-protein kinase RsbW
LLKFENISYIELPSRQEYIDYIITQIFGQINVIAEGVEDFNQQHVEDVLSNPVAGMNVGGFGFGINISIDEAIRNALIHGNKRNVKKKIFISYSISQEKLEVTIEDEGDGFDVEGVLRELELNLNPEEMGRGIILMKNFMDKVIFNSKGNKVTLIKYRNKL